jgi:hypothetical protein
LFQRAVEKLAVHDPEAAEKLWNEWVGKKLGDSTTWQEVM